MKRAIFALSAATVLAALTGCHGNKTLDKIFCEPCAQNQMFGGCWNGACGYGDCHGCGQGGCSSCGHGGGHPMSQGGEMVEGEVIMEDGMPMAACDCPSCQRRHGHGRGRHGRRGGGMGGMGGFGPGGFAGSGPPTPHVAYPYYTTRAPRDFLAANPRGIGR